VSGTSCPVVANVCVAPIGEAILSLRRPARKSGQHRFEAAREEPAVEGLEAEAAAGQRRAGKVRLREAAA